MPLTQPTVALFNVHPNLLPVGGEARIDYVVAGGETVTLHLNSAQNGSRTLPIASGDFAGSLSTGPLLESTQISIEVRQGAMTAQRSLDIWIEGAPEPEPEPSEPYVNTFTADSEQILPGGEVNLSWHTTNARTVELLANGTVIAQDLPAIGMSIDFPLASTTYTLVASNHDHQSESALTVHVNEEPTAPLPEIEQFELNLPSFPTVGDSIMAFWRVSNASHVQIVRQSEGFEEEILRFQSTQVVDLGQWLLTPPVGTSTYILRAAHEGKLVESSPKMVTVQSIAEPVVLLPTVDPHIISYGGDDDCGSNQNCVTVRWTVMPADAEVIIFDPNGGVFETIGSGSVSVTIPGDLVADFLIEAQGLQGGDLQWVRAWWLGGELEPNDTLLQATPIDAFAREGQIELDNSGTGWESDWFSVNVLPEGRISVDFDDTSCPVGFYVELTGPGLDPPTRFQTTVADVCPEVLVFPPNSGTYGLRLSMEPGLPSSPTEAVSYSMFARTLPPTCGDGQTSNDEACDDGNGRSGDGCSSQCETEYRLLPDQAPVRTIPTEGGEPLQFRALDGESADDEGIAVVEFPQPFPFFGQRILGAFVSTNGYITLISPGQNPRMQDPFGPQDPNGLIGLFVADLQQRPDGDVRFEVEADGRMVFRFNHFTIKGAPDGDLVGEIVLSPNGDIALYYGPNIGNGLINYSVQAGLENPRGQFSQSVCVNRPCLVTEIANRRFLWAKP